MSQRRCVVDTHRNFMGDVMRLYVYAAAAVAALVGLSTLYYSVYSAGQRSVIAKLQSDRITVLQDGKRIDENVLSADDDELRCMLIDCERD